MLEEALGRSRGGFTSKLHVLSEARARPLAVVISGGQVHDSRVLEVLLDAVREPSAWRLASRIT